MKKKFTLLNLDGEEHSISDAKKQIIGKKRKYTIDEFQQNQGKRIQFLVFPPETVTEEIVFGFSVEKEYENWMISHNLFDKHRKMLLEKAKRELSPAEREKIEMLQKEEVRNATEKFGQFLKRHHLKSNEIDKIEEAMMNELDPYSEELSHSLYLYDNTWWSGNGIILSGKWFGGKYYYDLGVFDFGDRAESLSTWGSRRIELYEHVNYGGRNLTTFIALGDLNYVPGTIFGRNIASSAIVY
jgi:hypothetical protein